MHRSTRFRSDQNNNILDLVLTKEDNDNCIDYCTLIGVSDHLLLKNHIFNKKELQVKPNVGQITIKETMKILICTYLIVTGMKF